MSEASPQAQVAAVARQLASQLEERQQEYIIGGAIALGDHQTVEKHCHAAPNVCVPVPVSCCHVRLQR
jgi:hypothetical protein